MTRIQVFEWRTWVLMGVSGSSGPYPCWTLDSYFSAAPRSLGVSAYCLPRAVAASSDLAREESCGARRGRRV